MKALAVHVLVVGLLVTAAVRVYDLRVYFATQETDAEQVAELQQRLDAVPLQLGGGQYIGEAQFETERVIEKSGADAYISRRYEVRDGSFQQLFVGSAQFLKGYFHAPRGCMPSQGWEIVEEGSVPFDAYPVETSSPEMRRMLTQRGLEFMLVHYWFQSGDRVGARMGDTHYFRAFDLMKNAPVKPVHIVTVYTPVVANRVADAEARAAKFIESIAPHLRDALK